MHTRHQVPSILASSLAAALLVLAGPTLALAAQPAGASRQAAQRHCNDLNGRGKLTCFATREQERAYIAASTGRRLPTEQELRVLNTASIPRVTVQQPRAPATTLGGQLYVTLYSDPNYTGSSVDLYFDYNDLGTIGWNDITSSTAPHGNAGYCSSDFWEHINYSGADFYTSTPQPRLYEFGWDDVISSVQASC